MKISRFAHAKASDIHIAFSMRWNGRLKSASNHIRKSIAQPHIAPGDKALRIVSARAKLQSHHAPDAKSAAAPKIPSSARSCKYSLCAQ